MRDIYAGGPVALYTVTVAGTTITKATHYLHRDHLGSVQSITDSSGKVTTVYRYDPFGKQQLVIGSNTTTHHGYTGHEMHNGAGFIHMNGRTYDPSLGRFMQADPNIDGATNLQGFNRYSYVQNNPLGATDPSGYFLSGLVKAAKRAVNRYRPYLAIAAGAVVTTMTGGCVTCGGFVSGYINTGTLKGAIYAGTSAYLMSSFSLASKGWSALGRAGAMGSAGGFMSLAQNRDFKSGFVGGAYGSLMSGVINFGGKGLGWELARTAAAGAVSGAGAALMGGDFASGAGAGAFAYMSNSITRAMFDRGEFGRLHLTGHRVGVVGPTHLAIENTGEKDWLSAGPSGGLNPSLASGSQGMRPSDGPDFNYTVGEIIPPAGMSGSEYFNVLKTANFTYQNNLEYDTLPGISNGYNSTGHVLGLIQSTGGTVTVDTSRFVGSGRLVPAGNFGY